MARRLGFRRTVAPFVVTKMVLAVRIRDNLSLICLDADLPDRCDKVEVAKLLRAVRPEAY